MTVISHACSADIDLSGYNKNKHAIVSHLSSETDYRAIDEIRSIINKMDANVGSLAKLKALNLLEGIIT